jgi:hypothetical protein
MLNIPAGSRLLIIFRFAGPSSILQFNFDYAAKIKFLSENRKLINSKSMRHMPVLSIFNLTRAFYNTDRP